MTTAVPPAQRGKLRIADHALARIAARAAETALAPRLAAPPKVTAHTHAGIARLTIGLTLPFPADLAALARVARQAAAERVRALTGIRVGEVTVVVERLESP